MHYLITGHTGFKGAWLSLVLKNRGHSISGLSLNPSSGSLFETMELKNIFENDFRVDIKNLNPIKKIFKEIEPDVVIHLAAQPLVIESYKDPVNTYDSNIQGTLNILTATSCTSTVRAQLIVTTDKVYRNVNRNYAFVESDPLGGQDPYSTSKAIADLLTQSFTKFAKLCPTAIARAGNVIGGGDVSPNRLIPDLVNAYSRSEIPKLRFPNAVRPWQHVLDCINGYLKLIDYLLINQKSEAWNFGPDESEFKTVSQVADLVGEFWGSELSWVQNNDQKLHEFELLTLNSSKSRKLLGWEDKLSFRESVKWTTDWYKDVSIGISPSEATLKNILKFESLVP